MHRKSLGNEIESVFGAPRGKRAWIALALVFSLGAASGLAAAKIKVTPSSFGGKSAPEAAAALLDAGQTIAASGSWERIFVGRTRYLGGDKAAGQAAFDAVLGGSKAEGGDYVRVGRVYWEAGEWDKARPLFDKALALEPKDADWLAEIGAYYNLKGDRAHAEELFTRSLAEDPANAYNVTKMAGSYLGVQPD
jgi:tetratricopeptide (TPR) repeat protein